MSDFELNVIRFVQDSLQTPTGLMFVVVCARGLILVLILSVAVLGFQKQRTKLRHASHEAMWSAVLALALALALEQFIGRVRPFLAASDIMLLIPPPKTFSFPSGHASVAFAAALALMRADRRLGWIALALAVLIAFGRVAGGVHYPSDVLAGALVGWLAIYLVSLGQRKFIAS